MNDLPGPITLTRFLCIGASGSDVRALQAQLTRALTGAVLVSDGRFGRRTHKALLAFQRQKGLKVDGVVGPATASALGWSFQSYGNKPYVISYEKPPLPPMTPPLHVIAEVVWDAMQPFKDKILDDIAHAYDGYRNPYATRDQYNSQARQKFRRWEDLKYHFEKLRGSLDRLKAFSTGQDDLAVEEIKSAFHYFKHDMRSNFMAMDLFGADTTIPIRNIESLPSEQITDAIGRVMRGEQMAEVAIAQIRLSFEAARLGWLKSW